MGMSTHVYGIKPPDAKWKKMKAAYEACQAAGIDPPEELDDFFGGESPDKAGVIVDLTKSKAVSEWNGEMESGFQVDLTKLPKDVTIIRFFNLY